MGQIVGLDTAIFIYLLEDKAPYADHCANILQRIQCGADQGIFANLGMIELLTGPKRTQQLEQVHEFRNYLEHFPNLTLAELNDPVIEFASDFRAYYRISTPDAVHIACSIVYGADEFITNDKALKKIKEIKVKLL